MYFGEINLGIRVWFARRVRRTLEAIRDNEVNGWETRQQLSDPEIFEWVAEWYCEHIAEFIRDDPRDTFCVDDIHNDERVEYQSKAVCRRCPDARSMAIAAREGPREAQRFADLDGWLEALHAGELEWNGPSEKDGEDLVKGSLRKFRKAARQRRKHWPKSCRICGAEFRPKPANVKSCSSCLDKMRADRQAKRRAGASRAGGV